MFLCRSMEEHYQSLCAVVETRAILSLGLACFRWNYSKRPSEETSPEGNLLQERVGLLQDSAIPLEVEVFNVWLLTRQPFVTDPSSGQFLVKHGFDFNKQFSQGLPYTPPSARKKACTHLTTLYPLLELSPNIDSFYRISLPLLIPWMQSFAVCCIEVFL